MTTKIIPALRSLALCMALLASPVLFAAEEAGHYGWVSVLPPLLAIALALIIRQVVPAVFVGIWVGAWALNDFTLVGLFTGLLESFEVHVVAALADSGNASVVLFSMMIGGMVGIISKNGGLQGVVELIVGFADSARRASLATVAMGLAIFFDDYANTLVVGNTMRPVTDRMQVSREKLAYLVDSTAAPIASVALVTTWVGYEVGLIRDAMEGIAGLDANAYFVFLNSIAYSFYPLFALVLVFAVVLSSRDFGPMHAAERRAREEGQVAPESVSTALVDDDMKQVQPAEGTRRLARNAVVPVAILVVSVIAGLFVSGEGETLQALLESADAYKALLWGSLLGVVSAVIMTMMHRSLSIPELMGAWFTGLRSMLLAVVILVMAWALAGITEALGTAGFLSELLGDRLHPGLLPTVVFVLAAATAFSTGSSWGTMGILLPLMLPLTWALMSNNGMTGVEHMPILYGSVAAVLGGAVWGDHCSPISDTTILSSMASQCDHIEHVRTQMPYAVFAGVIAIVLGTLPAGFGVPWWICLPIGALALIVGVRMMGREVLSVKCEV
ncbi:MULTISPECIES: Na+/H+ antiporter NhaC family protein [unclassified Wenzhouxiangella]|uniref:Na+/H+ antiporter NhaC family protein n=1 Tax=unclassified Wenzhouxiangella TaxID=2613841 RepID=UPI000E3294C3|nr:MULTISPECIES: Na+/H+ antiporter NhaC family protein [unclassified Wenzhouxiangella]RFF28305.1 Na+/H+ antiporter NhaC family protein [Wenzhouxiangella sp. 15181]RFP67770.1 Na+/H+ antiporter NhaC family protein [Wenzhouxiangella sp. 15190]